jgi:integral membrane protein
MALRLGPLNDDPAERAATLRRLNLIAVVAVIDALLLAVLLWASFGDRESLVHILGPIHGIGFLLLLVLCLRGTVEERWDWSFPALVVVTGGPLGSLIGDYVLRRRLRPGAPLH